MNPILVINSGSSSLKYKLFNASDLSVLNTGIIENIGQDVVDHASALKLMLKALGISNFNQISAVAHRVVHGGELYSKATRIDEKVIADIDQLSALAPLHNPANLLGITSIQDLAPKLKQIAVFDTAFHQSMPPESYLYALPYELYKEEHIRRYGFHGSSHKYVSQKAAQFLDIELEKFNTISLHLGNGASACAIKEGLSFDTSMGFTPLEGLIMGTRSGDIDPAIISYLVKSRALSIEEIDILLTKKSGLKALCGDNNMKNILARSDEEASLARDKFILSIQKYIGAYMAILPSIDAIIFTGGIGENSAEIRSLVAASLKNNFHILLDEDKNQTHGEDITLISQENSSVKLLVIPTDEELQIAQESLSLLD